MKVWIMAAFFSVVLIITVAFLVYPQIDRYMEFKNELYIKEKSYEYKEDAYGQYAQKSMELQQLNNEYQSIREALPPLHKMTEKMVEISKLLKQHGLTEREFSIGDTIKNETVDGEIFKATVTITATGSYDGAMAYIAAIESLSNICTVDDVIMSSENIAIGGDINFVLRITIYSAKEGQYEMQKKEGSDDVYAGNPFYYEQ